MQKNNVIEDKRKNKGQRDNIPKGSYHWFVIVM